MAALKIVYGIVGFMFTFLFREFECDHSRSRRTYEDNQQLYNGMFILTIAFSSVWAFVILISCTCFWYKYCSRKNKYEKKTSQPLYVPAQGTMMMPFHTTGQTPTSQLSTGNPPLNYTGTGHPTNALLPHSFTTCGHPTPNQPSTHPVEAWQPPSWNNPTISTAQEPGPSCPQTTPL